MKDIQKAIEAETQYIQDRLNEIDVSLIDILNRYGFFSLNEYFIEKQAYLFDQLEFNYVEEPMPNGVSEIFNMIQNNKPGVLFVDWEDTYVVSGNQGLETLNKEYCEANKITIFPLYTDGGTIVGSKGDFSLGICCPKDIINSSDFILNSVKDILQRHTDLEITVQGNDICADNNKICGSAGYSGKDVYMVIMHFSFNDWSELISKICVTNKIGKTVSYVNFMTRNQFKQEVSAWLL